MANTKLVENMIQLAEDEQKLFESVLAVEFRKAQVLKEDGNLDSQKDPDEGDDVNPAPAQADNDTADDAVKEGIFKKIGTAISNALQWLKEKFNEFITKVKQVILIDNGIVKRYVDAINKADLSKFPGIDNIVPVNPDFRFDQACATFDVMAKGLSDCSIIGGSVEIESNMKKLKEECDKAYAYANHEPSTWKPSSFKVSTDVFTKSDPVKAAMKTVRYFNVNPNSIIGKIKSNAQAKKAEADKGSAEWQAGIKTVMEGATLLMSTYRTWHKSIRRSIVEIGAWVLKTNKQAEKPAEETKEAEKTEEVKAEAVCWLAGISSDAYIDEQFAFI